MSSSDTPNEQPQKRQQKPGIVEWPNIAGVGFELQAREMQSGKRYLVLMPAKPARVEEWKKKTGQQPVVLTEQQQAEAFGKLGFTWQPLPEETVKRTGVKGLWRRDSLKINANDIRAVLGQKMVTTDPRPVGEVIILRKKQPAPASKPEPRTAVEAAVEATRFLGRNAMEQAVYQGVDGRFIRPSFGREIFEADATDVPPGMFLRAVDDYNLGLCVDAYVRDIRSVRQTFKDFTDFAAVIHDERSLLGDPETWPADRLGDLHEKLGRTRDAIDDALARSIATGSHDRSVKESFTEALALHEHHPLYAGENAGANLPRPQVRTTPLPLSVVATRLLGNDSELYARRILAPGAKNGGLLAMLPRAVSVTATATSPEQVARVKATARAAGLKNLNVKVAEGATAAADAAYFAPTDADFVIGDFPYTRLPEPVEVGGLRITREDHLAILKSLENRHPAGRAVFMLSGPREGEEDEAKAVLDKLAQEYVVEGIVDVSSALYAGRVGAPPARIISLGARRPAPAMAERMPVPELMRSYEDLWGWSSETIGRRIPAFDRSHDLAIDEALDAAEGDEIQSRGNDDQVPYVSTSKRRASTLMIPRSMAKETTAALEALVAKYGDLEEWLASQFGWSLEELDSKLEPHQVDGAVMMIDNMMCGTTCLLGDDPGTGKGRECAVAMAWWLMQGEEANGVFMTENAGLFKDWWGRDWKALGLQHLARPWILNAGVTVRDMATNEVILTSMPDEEIERAIQAGTAAGEWPVTADGQRANLLLTTFSQVNRIPGTRAGRKVDFLRKIIGPNTLLGEDEAHNASNPNSNQGKNIKLLRDAAGAKFQSSGTAAKEMSNLLTYPIWPDDIDPDALAKARRAGFSRWVDEMPIKMLAESGRVIVRQQDADVADYVVLLDEKNLARNKDYMDRMAEIVSNLQYLSGEADRIVARLNKAAEEKVKKAANQVAAKANALQVTRSDFSSAAYRLQKLSYACLKADFIAEKAVEFIEQGYKPVISLQNTLEALLKDIAADPTKSAIAQRNAGAANPDARGENAVAQLIDGDKAAEEAINEEKVLEAIGGDVNELLGNRDDTMPPPDFKDVLLRILDQSMRVRQTKKNVEAGILYLHEQYPEMKEAYEALRNEILLLPDLPATPFDTVRDRIEEAGYTCAEISGRRTVFKNGRAQKIPKADYTQSVASFNDGSTHVLLSNITTGWTGSAQPEFADQSPRVMLVMDPQSDFEQMKQNEKRVARLKQVCKALIAYVDSGIPAENRMFMMMQENERSMNATTQGQGATAKKRYRIPNMFNKIGDEVAFEILKAEPNIALRMSLSDAIDKVDRRIDEREDGAVRAGDILGLARRFAARLFGLRTDEQHTYFERWLSRYLAKEAELDARGLNPTRPKRVPGTFEVVERKILRRPVRRPVSAFGKPIELMLCRGKEFVEPLRGKKLEQLVLSGKMMLGRDNAQAAADRLRGARQYYLGEALKLDQKAGLAVQTIEQALETEANTIVKSTLARLDLLAPLKEDVEAKKVPPGIFDRLKPGGLVVLSKDMSDEARAGVVVKLEIPPAGMEHNLGSWRVHIVFPGESENRGLIINLNELINDKNFDLEEGMDASLDAKDEILQIFDGAEQGERDVAFWCLGGNPIQAAIFKAEHKITGLPVQFQDGKGHVHEVLMLKEDWAERTTEVGQNGAKKKSERILVPPRELMDIPIKLDEPDVACALLAAAAEQKMTLQIRSDAAMKADGINAGYVKSAKQYRISIPEAMLAKLDEETRVTFRNRGKAVKNEEKGEDGEGKKQRKRIEAQFKELEEFRRAVEGVYAGGHAFHAHGEFADWVNRFVGQQIEAELQRDAGLEAVQGLGIDVELPEMAMWREQVREFRENLTDAATDEADALRAQAAADEEDEDADVEAVA